MFWREKATKTSNFPILQVFWRSTARNIFFSYVNLSFLEKKWQHEPNFPILSVFLMQQDKNYLSWLSQTSIFEDKRITGFEMFKVVFEASLQK